MTIALLAPQKALDRTRESMQSVPSVQAKAATTLHRRFFRDHAAWHGTLFFGLAALAIRQRRGLRWKQMLFGLALLSVYSMSVELIQEHFVPGRSFAWSDIAVNQIGIVLGLAVGLLVDIVFKQRWPRTLFRNMALPRRALLERTTREDRATFHRAPSGPNATATRKGPECESWTTMEQLT